MRIAECIKELDKKEIKKKIDKKKKETTKEKENPGINKQRS